MMLTPLLLQPNSCGYGILEPSIFPDGHLGTLSSSDPLNKGLAQGGCGACVEVTCTDSAQVLSSSSGMHDLHVNT